MVVAPHPDDEIFGAGGIILNALENKKSVYVLYLTDGENSGVHNDQEIIRIQRVKLLTTVMSKLEISQQCFYRFHLKDGAIPNKGSNGFDDVVEKIKVLIDEIRPDNVLCTTVMDYWPVDHVSCAELTEAAVIRSLCQPNLYYYWVWSWYHVKPWRFFHYRKNYFAVNISSWYSAKKSLVNLYLNSKTEQGKAWCGVLPAALIKSFDYKYEILSKNK
jgi:LmbE family N-acetylglucosaminyl deacetylase